ncbi:MAG: glutamine--fructose-6-phosphate transaminase (isomerizing) [Gammaproteobacteria bacterium]|nr:glutamine--fructose-6-phosphate transaminase (isomerizing) [Gammaproteobacteria bacterium]
MCGVIAGLSLGTDIKKALWDGLCALEYRGYDSFGIGYKTQTNYVELFKKLGAPSNETWPELRPVLIGLGHTRWATHGIVAERNAHPHYWNIRGHDCMIVHNGVVENYEEIRSSLPDRFRNNLKSDTDSECILAKIAEMMECYPEWDFKKAIAVVIDLLKGSFAIVLSDLTNSQLIAAKLGLPLAVSFDQDQSVFIVSDLAALPAGCTKAIFISDYDIISYDGSIASVEQLQTYCAQQKQYAVEKAISSKNTIYASYLEAEIYQQIELLPVLMYQNDFDFDIYEYEEIHLIGCGSSYYAGWFATLLRSSSGSDIPVHAYIASEFLDQPPLITRKTLLIALSQSGETADVLSALRSHGSHYARVIAFCNRSGALIEQHVDKTIAINAGPEYSVASTKVFTAQIVWMGHLFKHHDTATLHVRKFSQAIAAVIQDRAWQKDVKSFASFNSILIIARGFLIPIAAEGALKMRELTYKHVHAFPAGELKHGTLALVDEKTLVIVCAQADHTDWKQLIAVQEVKARKAKVWIIGQESSRTLLESGNFAPCVIPCAGIVETAILFTIVFQMLALQITLELNQHPDRPRNLAKSVTVE